jgi:nucleotide-binding universal stress UspA family protein
MRWRKILVATDFSEGSERALRVAVRLASKAGAELVVAHAWEVGTGFGGELPVPSDLAEELKEEVDRGLEAALREARALGAPQATARWLDGAAPAAILRALEDPGFDLVIVGTHGRTGLSRVLLGSVAEKIVRHAPCSVLVVRVDSEATPFKHVLCPIDLSQRTDEVFEEAAGLAQDEGACVTLLNVIDITPAYTGRAAGLYIQLLERSSSGLLEKAAARLRSKLTVPVSIRSGIGSPGGQILALLDEDRTIDLVVMGSHGRTGIKRALLGSVAEKVVRHAHCPVLVSRNRD